MPASAPMSEWRGPSARQSERQRGVALITVLWVLVVLALIAGNFARTARTETVLTRNLLENASAEALADAGVRLAVLGVSHPDTAARWIADGRPYEGRYGEAALRVSVIDESGKVDLNRAKPELLTGLFRSVGLDSKSADALVDAVIDYRDPDDLRRVNGAEDRDYEAAGLPYGAKDRPFESLSELRQVLGITPELFRMLKPSLTVWSGRPGINPNFAPASVLRSIPGITEDQIESTLALRTPEEPASFNRLDPAALQGLNPVEQAAEEADSGQRGSNQGILNSLPQDPNSQRLYNLRGNRGIYSVTVEAHLDQGAVFVRETVIQVSRNPRRPFVAYTWQQGRPGSRPGNQEIDDEPADSG